MDKVVQTATLEQERVYIDTRQILAGFVPEWRSDSAVLPVQSERVDRPPGWMIDLASLVAGK